MRAFLLICLSFCCGFSGFSQAVEVLHRSDKQFTKKGKDFACLAEATDTNQLTFVAQLKAADAKNKSGIEDLFQALRKQANRMGANTYRLVAYSPGEEALVLNVYLATKEQLAENFDSQDKNAIFIFGSESVGAPFTFKLNNEKKTLRPGTYFRYDLREEEAVKISKTGLASAVQWFKWKENKPAVFLTLSSFGIGGKNAPESGRLHFVDANLGYLLVQVLKPAEMR